MNNGKKMKKSTVMRMAKDMDKLLIQEKYSCLGQDSNPGQSPGSGKNFSLEITTQDIPDSLKTKFLICVSSEDDCTHQILKWAQGTGKEEGK